MYFDDYNLKMLAFWICERESIRDKKEHGDPKPWTADEVLSSFRFCNVHREDDAVTKWIADNWRSPLKNSKVLWFAMLLARLVNKPSTLELITPIPWDPKKFRAAMTAAKEKYGTAFNAAYIVSTNGVAMDKVDYLIKHVLSPAWEKGLDLHACKSLAEIDKELQKLNGVKGFISGQVIADIKYVKPFLDLPDWHTWAASGPGSRRGLNRLLCRRRGDSWDVSWRESHWLEELLKLQRILANSYGIDLHAQDLQNCLCEFDKFMRAKNKEGRPKQAYPGNA